MLQGSQYPGGLLATVVPCCTGVARDHDVASRVLLPDRPVVHLVLEADDTLEVRCVVFPTFLLDSDVGCAISGDIEETLEVFLRVILGEEPVTGFLDGILVDKVVWDERHLCLFVAH